MLIAAPNGKEKCMTLMELLDKSVPEANKWVKDFMAELHINAPRLARKLLSSTLYAWRDYLPYQEAEKFGNQLPLVMREHFFQGWCSIRNRRWGNREEFFRRLRRYCNFKIPIAEERVVRAFCRVLYHRIAQHEIEDSSGFLADELYVLWPLVGKVRQAV